MEAAATIARPRIRRLSTSLVNKIAAGEVIERPASVVKEVLENALDAGASRIDVVVEGGGTDLIRVADDGSGIDPDDLPLAVASHATSKLQSTDDLFRVRTLGFRGEALASIAEVSRFRLRSRLRDAEAGAELNVEGGVVEGPVPSGGPPGTTVEVRNLFFNTPVRKKFLRTPQTETAHVVEAFLRAALAWPGVHFTLRSGERVVHDLPAVVDWSARIGDFFGPEVRDALLPVDCADGDVRFSGFVARPEVSRANNRLQYLFLNGRYIRDRALQHALSEAYRGLLLTGRFPVAFLRLDMPPELADVNVHPAKLEVRFQDGGRLYGLLLGGMRTKFLSTDLTAGRPPAASEAGTSESAAADDEFTRRRAELTAWANARLAGSDEPPTRQNDLPFASALPADDLSRPPLTLHRLPSAFRSHGDFQPFPPLPESSRASGSAPEPRETLDLPPVVAESSAAAETGPVFAHGAAGRPPVGMQIHNRYLVAEDEHGLAVIDQHALHERILYEQFRARVLAGVVESQRLLAPEPVTLPAEEAAALLEARELLARMGLHVEPFGGETVVVTAYPAMLANFAAAETLREIAATLLAGAKSPDRRDLLDELLHMASCKAAVKAGDRLAPAEIAALLEHRRLCQDAHHCPHGRPTALVLTREELDKRFKRT